MWSRTPRPFPVVRSPVGGDQDRTTGKPTVPLVLGPVRTSQDHWKARPGCAPNATTPARSVTTATTSTSKNNYETKDSKDEHHQHHCHRQPHQRPRAADH